jgi:hypothetical protein
MVDEMERGHKGRGVGLMSGIVGKVLVVGSRATGGGIVRGDVMGQT